MDNSLTSIERSLIKHRLTFPELSKSILRKIDFSIDGQELIKISNTLNQCYGTIVDLNKSFNLSKPNKETYNKIVELFVENNKNLNINANILKRAVPYIIFLDLCRFIIEEKRRFREEISQIKF